MIQYHNAQRSTPVLLGVLVLLGSVLTVGCTSDSTGGVQPPDQVRPFVKSSKTTSTITSDVEPFHKKEVEGLRLSSDAKGATGEK